MDYLFTDYALPRENMTEVNTDIFIGRIKKCIFSTCLMKVEQEAKTFTINEMFVKSLSCCETLTLLPFRPQAMI